MWNKLQVHQEHSSAVLHCAVNHRTKLLIDLVDVALGIKLLLWSSHSCAYLPWLGQWIFGKWSHLKDTRWHLNLSPAAQCTWPLKLWSIPINHCKQSWNLGLPWQTWQTLLLSPPFHFLPFSSFTLRPAGVMQSASSTSDSKVLYRKLLIFYHRHILQDSLDKRSLQGKPILANYIQVTLRRNMMFRFQRHMRVLLDITGEVMMSRVQFVVTEKCGI